MIRRAAAVAAIALLCPLATCRDAVAPVSAPAAFTAVAAPRANATSASWVSVAPMSTTRYAGAAATGRDGRVYVFGGLTTDNAPAGAEVYDPAGNRWSPIADQGYLYGPGIALGGDGRIYLAGGGLASEVTRTVRAYDPRDNTYVAVASMHVSRFGPAAASGSDGRVYIMGGFEDHNGHGGDPTASAEVYDPGTNTWTLIAPMSTERFNGAAATGTDGRIYAIGGQNASFTAQATAEVYDPATGRWSPIASMPGARYAHVAVAGADGIIYVIGGYDPAIGFIASVLAYDPTDNRWTAVASLSRRRYQPSGARGADGRIYAIGGNDGGTLVSSVEALQTTAPLTTNVTLTSSANPSVFGQPVTVTAHVQGSTGQLPLDGELVKFLDGSTILGVAELSQGSAVFAVPALSVGSHALQAHYYGLSPLPEALSNIVTQTVNKSASATTLIHTPNPSAVGDEVIYGAHVAAVAPGAGNPGGSVTFSLDGVAYASQIPVQNGNSFGPRFTTLPVGSHVFTAAYSGDGNFEASSISATHVVTQLTTSTTLTSSANPSMFSGLLRFTANVTCSGTPPNDGERITFSSDGVVLGTAALQDGSATLAFSDLSVGQHNITATYAGNANLSGSTSPALSQTVNKILTETMLVSLNNPSLFGEPARLVARLGTESGTQPTDGELVSFSEGGVVLGYGPLQAGSASVGLESLAPGSHTITASYGGNGSFDASTSSPVTQVVNKGATSVTLVYATNTSIVGDPVVYQADVAIAAPGVGSATGTVTFSVDGTVYDSRPLQNGHASGSPVPNSSLTIGQHVISAAYSGDGSFLPSTVQGTHTVNPPPNSAPVADAGGPYAGNEGSSIGFSAAGSSDPDNDALTYDWNFGDGSSAVNAGVAPSHAYADNGNYTATVTVNDGHGHVVSAQAAVTVSNVAPTVSAIAGAQLFPGDTYSASGTFTDPGTDTFSGAVDYGDGTSGAISVAGNAFALSHAYTTAGTYTVTVSVSDDDGGSTSQTATVTVLSAAGGTQVLGGSVQTLLTSGAITSQTSSQLTNSLSQVTASLASGNTTAATGKIDSFMNQVQAAINSGKISAADGAALIAFANQVKGTITP